MISTNHDCVVENQGSTWQFYFVTKPAQAWVDDNLTFEPWQGCNRLLSVDHRCGVDIVEGMRADGLIVVGRID